MQLLNITLSRLNLDQTYAKANLKMQQNNKTKLLMPLCAQRRNSSKMHRLQLQSLGYYLNRRIYFRGLVCQIRI